MRLITYQSFTSSTTWTCPAGVTSVIVTPNNYFGSGGGGATLLTVVPNTTYTITIGNNGQVSSFGALYQAKNSAIYVTQLQIAWMDG